LPRMPCFHSRRRAHRTGRKNAHTTAQDWAYAPIILHLPIHRLRGTCPILSRCRRAWPVTYHRMVAWTCLLAIFSPIGQFGAPLNHAFAARASTSRLPLRAARWATPTGTSSSTLRTVLGRAARAAQGYAGVADCREAASLHPALHTVRHTFWVFTPHPHARLRTFIFRHVCARCRLRG